MSSVVEPATTTARPTEPGDRGFFGHPRGLSTLFFTEMWERFSYYGMRAFLILYMVHVLGFDDRHAGSVYGTYTASVWGAPILGGIIADRWLGQYKSVLIGGIIIALGHFTLAFHPLPAFYAGLGLIVLGTGLLKPNVSGIVGSLYETNDARRDAGFSIFYMGINLGAALGPLIAGYLAQRVDWHVGFACAGVGMTAGLIQYVLGRRRLQPAVERLERQRREARAAAERAIEFHRRLVIGQRPHHQALQAALREILARRGEQAAAEAETLELRPQIKFVDFAVIKQAARAIAPVIGIASNLLAELQNGNAAAFADRRFPPIRSAPVDQLVEFVARDDALIGGPPCLIVRRGDVRRVGGLGSANLYEGRTHRRIEATNFAAFKPIINDTLTVWITGHSSSRNALWLLINHGRLCGHVRRARILRHSRYAAAGANVRR